MASEKRFNPNEHLRTFERRQRQLDGTYKTVGIDYLDVKWRIVWFREERPEGVIETELVSPPLAERAVVRAVVSYEATGGKLVSATAYGSCGADDWSEFLEKAETRAVGRALAHLGYGTQFTEEAQDEAIADSPVERGGAGNGQAPPQGGQRRRSQGAGQSRASMELMTPNQRKYIEALGRDAGMDEAELNFVAEERFGVTVDDLNKADASSLINGLQELKEERLRDSAT